MIADRDLYYGIVVVVVLLCLSLSYPCHYFVLALDMALTFVLTFTLWIFVSWAGTVKELSHGVCNFTRSPRSLRIWR